MANINYNSYIGLVRLGCTEEALRFWHSWGKDHHEVNIRELCATLWELIKILSQLCSVTALQMCFLTYKQLRLTLGHNESY